MLNAEEKNKSYIRHLTLDYSFPDYICCIEFGDYLIQFHPPLTME